MKTFGEIFQGKNNYFKIFRLIGAIIILYSNSGVLIPEGFPRIPVYGTNYTIGFLVVNLFFCFSGFLICASLERQKSILTFAIARFARIYPAIIVCSLLIAFIGAFLTHLSPGAYVSAIVQGNFFVDVLFKFTGYNVLGDVFDNSPHDKAALGSIWTLKYEFICYAFICMLFVTKLSKSKMIDAVILILLLIVLMPYNASYRFLQDENPIYNMLRLLTSFYVGICFYKYRFFIPHHIGIAAILLVLNYCFIGSLLFDTLFYISTSYILLYIAIIPNTFKFPHIDISYGIFLYAWPIEQLLIKAYPHQGYWSTTLETLVIAMSVAVFSWYFVELPSLNYARKLIKNNKFQFLPIKKLA